MECSGGVIVECSGGVVVESFDGVVDAHDRSDGGAVVTLRVPLAATTDEGSGTTELPSE